MINKTLIILLVGVLGIGVLGYAVLGSPGTATSLNTPTPGCSSPDINAQVTGVFTVKDGSVFGIEPEIDSIESIGLRTNALRIEPFDISVVARDSTTNEELDTFKGDGSLDSSDDFSREEFRLAYILPDQDCDGKLDNHDIDLTISIKETQDISLDTDEKEFSCSVRNEKINCG